MKSTTPGKVCKCLLLKFPGCSGSHLLSPGFNNVLGFDAAPKNPSNKFPFD